MSKLCPDCKIPKTKENAYVDKSKGGGLSTYCKDCFSVRGGHIRHATRFTPEERVKRIKERDFRRKRFYKYGLDDYSHESLFIEQFGLCAIADCNRMATEIDHCHKTDRVRGLLCRGHNIGIGLLGDDLDGVLKAVNYLTPWT